MADADLQKEKERLEAELEALGTKNVELVFETTDLKEQLAQANEKLSKSQQELEQTREELERAVAAALDEHDDDVRLQAELKEQLEKNKAQQEKYKELEAEKEALQTKLNAAELARNAAVEKLQAARADRDEEGGKLEELRRQLTQERDAALAKAQGLETDLTSMADRLREVESERDAALKKAEEAIEAANQGPSPEEQAAASEQSAAAEKLQAELTKASLQRDQALQEARKGYLQAQKLKKAYIALKQRYQEQQQQQAGEAQDSERLEQLERENEKLAEALEHSQQELEQVREAEQQLTQGKTEAEQKLAELERHFAELGTSAREQASQLSALQQSNTLQTSTVQSLESQLAQAREEKEKLEAQLESLSQAQTGEADSAQQKLLELKAERDELKQKLNEALQQLEEARAGAAAGAAAAEAEQAEKAKAEAEQAEKAKAEAEEAEKAKAEAEQAEKAKAEAEEAEKAKAEAEQAEKAKAEAEQAEKAKAAPPPPPPVPDTPPPADGVMPLRRLIERMEDILGSNGRMLVTKACSQCGVSPRTADPGELERVVEVIREEAPRFAYDPRQMTAVSDVLEIFKRAYFPDEEPEPEPLPDDVEPPMVMECEDEEGLARGDELLKEEKYEEALEHFQAMVEAEPLSGPANLGLVAALHGTRQWQKARELGPRLVGLQEGKDEKEFLELLTSAINHILIETKGADAKKALLLEMAQVNLKGEPEKAMDFLRQAELLPDVIENEGMIPYLICQLLEGGLEDRTRYLVAAMRTLPGQAELLDLMNRVYREERHKEHQPLAKAILLMARGTRGQAEEIEKRQGGTLAARTPDQSMVASVENRSEASVIRFCLTSLLPQNKIEPAVTDDTFEKLWESAENLTVDYPTALATAFSLFEVEQPLVKIGSDQPQPVLAAGGEPARVLLDKELMSFTEGEQRFHIFRTLYELTHRHLDLYRSAKSLTNEQKLTLVSGLYKMFKEAGSPIPDDVVQTMESLSPDDENFTETLRDMCHRLREATGMDNFNDIGEFCLAERPFRKHLEHTADRFAALVSGLAAGCYGVVRAELPDKLERIEENGLMELYKIPGTREAQLRVQGLWADRLDEVREE